MQMALVSFFLESVSDFLRLGTRRAGTHLSASPRVLDPEGWRAASAAIRATERRLDKIERESRRRLEGNNMAKAVHAVSGFALFQAAPAGGR